MNIGFDLDGIFIDGPPFIPKGIIEWLYRGPQDRDPKYRFPKTSLEQSIRKLSHSPIFRPRIYKNIEFLNKISEEKNLKLYLISSRYNFLATQTFEILKIYGIKNCFSKIYLNTENEQPHLFKKRILESLEINIFVEDDLTILKFLKNYYPKMTMLWYNPKIGTRLPTGIMHIKTLEEIYPYLK